MNPAVYTVTLDIDALGSQAVLIARQNDNQRSISISLRQRGLPYEIASGCTAVFAGVKPDGQPLYNDCIIEDNKIIYNFTPQTTAAEGKLKSEIRLYDKDQHLLTSPKFDILVGRQVLNDMKVLSQPEVGELTKLIAQCLDIIDQANKGEFDGKSAYEIAVENGFVGTEEEWLQSLKGVSYNGYAICYDEAAPQSFTGNKWYIPKSQPRPSGEPGVFIDVLWKQGRVDGLGYDVQLIWGEPGGADNEIIVDKANASDKLTGSHSIPTEGTVRYQLVEANGRFHWEYVSGELISTQFSSDTAAEVAEKLVPGMSLEYIPGMEIYVQLDKGNTAELMSLKDDNDLSLPVYGNGTGAKTGAIPAGYILHLINAGDHWQIINSGSVTPEELNRPVHTTMYIDIVGDGFGNNYAYYNGEKISANSILNHVNADGVVIARYDVPGTSETRCYYYSQKDSTRQPVFLRSYIENGVSKQAVITVDNNSKVTVAYREAVETDPTVPAWAKKPTKPTYTAEEVGALPKTGGVVNGDIEANTVKAKTLQTTGATVDNTINAFAVIDSDGKVYKRNKSSLGIPSEEKQTSWDAKSNFSGSYNDLRDKPTIPPAVTVDSELSTTSKNPAENQAVTKALKSNIVIAETGNYSNTYENWQRYAHSQVGWTSSEILNISQLRDGCKILIPGFVGDKLNKKVYMFGTVMAVLPDFSRCEIQGHVLLDESSLYTIGEKWELIESIKFEIEAPLIKNKEPDGKPYNFKAMMFKVDAGAEKTEYFQLNAYTASGSFMYLTFEISPQNYTYGEIISRNGYYEVFASTPWTNRYILTELKCTPYVYVNDLSSVGNPFTSIETRLPIPKGTTLEIWAVRA